MAMAERNVVEIGRSPAPLPEGAALGWIVRVDEQGLWVDTPENTAGPMLALSTVQLTPEALQAAIDDRRGAVLLFLSGSGQPVLIGLHQPSPVLEATVDPAEAAAVIDGQKVRLEGKDEVVLRCGKSSITLRRNGRVVIRGVQVESRASGRNRIKGGAVLIN